jgi:hypothetical protein
MAVLVGLASFRGMAATTNTHGAPVHWFGARATTVASFARDISGLAGAWGADHSLARCGPFNRPASPHSHCHLRLTGNIQSNKDKRTWHTLALLWSTRKQPAKTSIHATRFKTRKEHASTGPLGDAPHWMKDKNQKDSWNTFRVEIPWLQKSPNSCSSTTANDIKT